MGEGFRVTKSGCVVYFAFDYAFHSPFLYLALMQAVDAIPAAVNSKPQSSSASRLSCTYSELYAPEKSAVPNMFCIYSLFLYSL